MPVLIGLAYLIELALLALAYILRRVLVAVAVDMAWAYVKPRLLEWVNDYVPGLVIKWINYALELDLRYPLTPNTLTAAVNKKLALDEPLFTDITDRAKVRADCAALAIRRLNAAVPGMVLVPADFTGTMTAKKNLLYKIRIALKMQIRAGMETGESELLPADVIALLMAQLQDGYDFTPHVNIPGQQHEIGREMARWYARHLTRTWQPR